MAPWFVGMRCCSSTTLVELSKTWRAFLGGCCRAQTMQSLENVMLAAPLVESLMKYFRPPVCIHRIDNSSEGYLESERFPGNDSNVSRHINVALLCIQLIRKPDNKLNFWLANPSLHDQVWQCLEACFSCRRSTLLSSTTSSDRTSNIKNIFSPTNTPTPPHCQEETLLHPPHCELHAQTFSG